MGWDAISAIGSIVAAAVLLVATVAALVQLKHLRLANQIGSYVEIMRHMNSREMVEARTYAESHNFEDPETVRKALEGGLDHRLLEWGGYYQMVARLINLGILDRELFAMVELTAPRTWRMVRPLVYAMRAQDPNPRWIDLEYLIYTSDRFPINVKRYDAKFREAIKLESRLQEWLRQAHDACYPASSDSYLRKMTM
jgi:hypothetical protein